MIFLFLLFTFASAEVLELNQINFESTIQNNPYVMVKFFAPWCGHCKKLAPVFDEVSESTDIVVAKVDATEHTALASTYNISGYPTIKWFVNGLERPYRGGRTKDTITKFIKVETGQWLLTVDTMDELEELIEKGTVIATTLDTDEVKELSYTLGNVVNVTGIVDTNLTVYRNGIHEYKEGNLTEFAFKHAMPPIVDARSPEFRTIFSISKFHVVAFYEEEDEEELKKVMTELSKQYFPEYAFIVNPGHDLKVKQSLGMTPEQNVILVQTHPFVKYNVQLDTLAEQVKQHKQGLLPPFYKSEKVPEQEEGKPHVLVGTTFTDYVQNNNVFVKFYAPWCGHCKQLAPIWDELAQHTNVAKYNMIENDHPDLKVKGFPTLRYYKNGKPIEYSGNRTLEDLLEFANMVKEQNDL